MHTMHASPATLMCRLLLLLVPVFSMTPVSGASPSSTNKTTTTTTIKEKPIHARHVHLNTTKDTCKGPDRELLPNGPGIKDTLCLATCPPGWITTRKLCLQSTKVSFPADLWPRKLVQDACGHLGEVHLIYADAEKEKETGMRTRYPDPWCLERCPAGMQRKEMYTAGYGSGFWCMTEDGPGVEESWTRPGENRKSEVWPGPRERLPLESRMEMWGTEEGKPCMQGWEWLSSLNSLKAVDEPICLKVNWNKTAG